MAVAVALGLAEMAVMAVTLALVGTILLAALKEAWDLAAIPVPMAALEAAALLAVVVLPMLAAVLEVSEAAMVNKVHHLGVMVMLLLMPVLPMLQREVSA